MVFKDRTEFSGSLLKQLEDIFADIDRFNRTRAEKERAVLDYLSMHDKVTRKQLEDALGFSQSVAIRTLKKLLDQDLIEKHGSGKKITYKALPK